MLIDLCKFLNEATADIWRISKSPVPFKHQYTNILKTVGAEHSKDQTDLIKANTFLIALVHFLWQGLRLQYSFAVPETIERILRHYSLPVRKEKVLLCLDGENCMVGKQSYFLLRI